jgi:uncharacterized caspase-like protein
MFPKQSLAIGISHHNPSRLNLKPCIADAVDLSSALKSIGFDAMCVTDTDLYSTQVAIRKFLKSIQPGAVVLFYFSGHGAQKSGNNYLIPSDAVGISGGNIESTTIDAQAVIEKIHQRKPRLVICVLDCCRSDVSDDAIDAGARPRGILPGVKAGLAPMEAPPGTLIVFACAAGAAASAQAENKRNSLYTYHLLRYIRTPNMDIESVLKYVSADVEKESDNWQVPFRYSSCNEFICLVSGVAVKGFGRSPRAPIRKQPVR